MSIQVLKPKFHTDECLLEIKECLDNGWTGMGFKTIEFENKWKEYTGHTNAHFLNSATAGLDLAFKILKKELDWGDSTEIITTPLTFVSTNHAILYNNLVPCFADVDEYLCLDPIDIEKKINTNTKAVIFVGYGGRIGKLDEIIELCIKYNLKLILDAAHMSGTKKDGIAPGTWSGVDVTIYSYQAVKNLPTADSGMICFKETKFDELARKFSWLGINKDTFSRTSNSGNYKWDYNVDEVGYKYHGNSIVASIALVQLKYLDDDNLYRKKLVGIYSKLLESIKEVRIIPYNQNSELSYHIFPIEVDNRDELVEYLSEKDIYVGVHYKDNTRYPMYSSGFGSCPIAHKMSNRVLSLPLHLGLTETDLIKIVSLIEKFFHNKV